MHSQMHRFLEPEAILVEGTDSRFSRTEQPALAGSVTVSGFRANRHHFIAQAGQLGGASSTWCRDDPQRREVLPRLHIRYRPQRLLDRGCLASGLPNCPIIRQSWMAGSSFQRAATMRASKLKYSVSAAQQAVRLGMVASCGRHLDWSLPCRTKSSWTSSVLSSFALEPPLSSANLASSASAARPCSAQAAGSTWRHSERNPIEKGYKNYKPPRDASFSLRASVKQRGSSRHRRSTRHGEGLHQERAADILRATGPEPQGTALAYCTRFHGT